MNTFRLGSLIRRTASQVSTTHHQLRRCSGSFTSSFPKPRFFSDVTDGESEVFHHARLFRKLLRIKFKSNLSNSVKLMGFVDRPIRVMDTKTDSFGVFTVLRVKDPRNPNRSFRILLSMWDSIARKCIAHLKPKDHIFVSGRLVFYNKSSSNESSGLGLRDCKVEVTEVNYMMAPPSDVVDSITSEKPKSETESLEMAREDDSIEETNNNDKIYLWQVFFSNPYDWWDNRSNKKNPKQPDFKHKDTGEALWLGSDKPVWVTRQLELFDQRKANKSHYYDQEHTRRGRLSEWV